MRVVLEFFRGPRDGEIIVGDPDTGALDEASIVYQVVRSFIRSVLEWSADNLPSMGNFVT
jgi:hypothetical protein